MVGVLIGFILFENESLLASSTTGIKAGFLFQINKLNNFGLGYYLSAWDLGMSPIEVPMWNNYD